VDRLPLVVGLAAIGLSTACGDPAGAAKGGPERAAVVERTEPKADPSEICEVFHSAPEATAFVYPELTVPAGASGRARWINVWATWCEPCIEELPRITAWPKRLRDAGVPMQLELIAVDEADALDEFAKSHPETSDSLRVRDPNAMPEWLGRLGLDEKARLPIHLFVDAQDRLRCVRYAGVDNQHYDAVLALARTL
jgi:thiol-disulfide isomerase/thioredoxin